MQPPGYSGVVFTHECGLWVAVPARPPDLEGHARVAMHRHEDVPLGRDYYIGWLSAAELHGAAIRGPPGPVGHSGLQREGPERRTGAAVLRRKRRPEGSAPPTAQCAHGRVRVFSQEVKVLDLGADTDLGAGISNIAAVVGELAEEAALTPSGRWRHPATSPWPRTAGSAISSTRWRPPASLTLSDWSQRPATISRPTCSRLPVPTSGTRVRVNTEVEFDL